VTTSRLQSELYNLYITADRIRTLHTRYATPLNPGNINATTPWDPWDASFTPALEIVGTECIWFPPTSATCCHFRWAVCEAYGASPDLLEEFKGRRKEEWGRELVQHAWVEQ